LRHNRRQKDPYPIAISLAYLNQLQFDSLRPPALGVVLHVEADLRALVELGNSGFLHGCDMHEHVLAAALGRNKTITFGLIEELHGSILAHDKDAPLLFVENEICVSARAASRVKNPPAAAGFCQPDMSYKIRPTPEALLIKQASVVLCSVLFAGMCCGPALSKPKQTTKYVYYAISGNTPAAIYSALVSRGPRVGGIKAYASTTAVSSQTGKMLQGKSCQMQDYSFNIDFTIKLPKLKNENALQGGMKTQWRNFSQFLRTHEETHRSIWLSCGAALEAKIRAIKAKSCDDFNAKTVKLWDQIRASCAKKQDAFDVAEQRRLVRQPFMVMAHSRKAKSSLGLKVPKKK
jgi:predicted secreted Zn-dependent protease